uniref:Uncharacterized protein n=1 Tax=Junco hyemalis TaxID=40217 RepID=A0A8C5JHX5_JUNHY
MCRQVSEGTELMKAAQAEAGQEQLAQGRAQLQRYRQESSTQLVGTRNELARLHTRLEAARRDVRQWVRGMWGAQGPPGRGGSSTDPRCTAQGDAQCGGGAKVCGLHPFGLS